MRKIILFIAVFCLSVSFYGKGNGGKFPNGDVVSEWFSDTSRVDIDPLGRKYVLTDYGVKNDSSLLQTEAIQRVIDLAASQGGGVVGIPPRVDAGVSLQKNRRKPSERRYFRHGRGLLPRAVVGIDIVSSPGLYVPGDKINHRRRTP